MAYVPDEYVLIYDMVNAAIVLALAVLDLLGTAS